MEAAARKRADRGEKTQLFRLMKQFGRTRLTSGVWARALDDGDAMAHDLIGRAVGALGTGIASAINLSGHRDGDHRGRAWGSGSASPTPTGSRRR